MPGTRYGVSFYKRTKSRYQRAKEEISVEPLTLLFAHCYLLFVPVSVPFPNKIPKNREKSKTNIKNR